MPIYQYKCSDCGHSMEALQKMSDPKLVDCPACDAPALQKQVTAASFKLKGTGWYETDFKNSGAAPKSKDSKETKDSASGDDSSPSTEPSSSKESSKAASGAASSSNNAA